jgi:hypothetical protein
MSAKAGTLSSTLTEDYGQKQGYQNSSTTAVVCLREQGKVASGLDNGFPRSPEHKDAVWRTERLLWSKWE